jgi:O-antigen/teichoic acid export membrane protein
VFGGVVLANAGNYVFQLIAGRYLGPAPYGDLAALLAVTNLIALPLGGVQIWVARTVAEYKAADELQTTRWFIRRALLYALAAGVIGALALLLLSGAIQSALSIHSSTAVVFTTLTVLPAFVTPVVWGLTQGLERFSLIAAMVASAPLLRIVIGVATLTLGYGVAGAMAATLFATVATVLVPLWLVRGFLTPGISSDRRMTRANAVRSLAPVVLGLLAITALTSVDVLVAKRWFDNHIAGVYGSASLIGRLILYLPAAIVTVLLPRVAARTVAQVSSLDLLGWSLLATAVFGAIATATYAAAPSLIIDVSFGSAYGAARPLLWPFGLAMSAFALLNVLLIYHLGRREYLPVYLLTAGSLSQLAVFALVRTSPRGLIWIDTTVAFTLFAAHELLTRGTATRAIRTTLGR